MKKLIILLTINIYCITSFSQSGEIRPNEGISIKTTNSTTGIFGTSNTGISIQQNWPAIGFNQYRAEGNIRRYIGTGFANVNYLDPSTGHLYWNSITTGTAGDITPAETTSMKLFPDGTLSLNGFNSPTNGLSISGSSNITPIISNSATDGAIRIYSPMPLVSTEVKFLDIDKDALQARKIGAFPSLIKSEQNLRLNPYGGNIGIGTADNSIAATLFVIKSTTSLEGTAVFKGTTHYSHFHYGANEDTYIRGGKNNSKVIINDIPGGKVGIGVVPSLYTLEVNGTTRATEVIVETGWADYVFDEKYSLRSIDEMEAFIKENKHLPNVPKASEIETNGLKIGETNKAMMEKIEELALYIIQLKKEIDVLKAKN